MIHSAMLFGRQYVITTVKLGMTKLSTRQADDFAPPLKPEKLRLPDFGDR
jgi:hypothetical protein